MNSDSTPAPYLPCWFRRTPNGYAIQSAPGTTIYEIVRNADGTLYCPCASFEFSKGPKDCKHCRHVRHVEREGAKVKAELVARFRKDPDGTVEDQVANGGPLPDMGGMLVATGSGKKVEKIGGISI